MINCLFIDLEAMPAQLSSCENWFQSLFLIIYFTSLSHNHITFFYTLYIMGSTAVGICVVSLWVLQPSSTIQRHAVSGVRLIGDSKLLLGVIVSGNDCQSLCVGPATDCRGIQDVSSEDFCWWPGVVWKVCGAQGEQQYYSSLWSSCTVHHQVRHSTARSHILCQAVLSP